MTMRAAKFTAGQAVEVEVTDFSTPGYPRIWAPGVVESVTVQDEKRGLWNVHVKRTDTENAWAPQVVGPRGGNKRIRAA